MSTANALLSYQYYAIVLMTIGDAISVSLHLILLNHRKCKNIVHHQHKFVEGDAMTGKKKVGMQEFLEVADVTGELLGVLKRRNRKLQDFKEGLGN